MGFMDKRRGFWGCLTLLSLFLWAGPIWAQDLRYPIKEPILTPEGMTVNPIAARLHDEGVEALQQVSMWLEWRHEELGQAIAVARRAVPGTEKYAMSQEFLGRAIAEDALARFWVRRAMEEAIGRLILVNEFEPTFALAHYNCAAAFISRNRMGDVGNAVHHLEMGLELDPQNRMLRAFYQEIVGKG